MEPRHRPRSPRRWILFAGAASLAGCRTQAVIDSIPRGAVVEVDGVRGVTPFTLELPTGSTHMYAVVVEKPGYITIRTELDRRLNPTGLALGVAFPPLWLGMLFRAEPLTTFVLEAEPRFPDAFAHEEPAHPALPPLPPAMTEPVRSKR